MNIYETDQLLGEYLLFHYGTALDTLPPGAAVESALFYPQRCVTECLEPALLGTESRALDLGCAVGRSSFELACYCGSVLGIDYSHRFVEAAERMRREGALVCERLDEGALTTVVRCEAPTGVDARRLAFEQGDAQNLRPDLGAFDVVLMANLIDRLQSPQLCLARLPQLVLPGGQLIITSPYTWREEFTSRAAWLGGFERNGRRVTTLDGLREALDPTFSLTGTKDLPFLIREHARKFQWSVAQASLWRRRNG